ncbi:GT-D fold domain-containing glycosyltransferase [Glutamicibacter protophormiae]|uniref:GT-D fold domain-containing glycosyltransferase n=1 Tax=Glutamicibacter protophormiae TaxID=37930 RepID=UPI001956F0C8|nr:GT-D fold domain-containing glycosyltransferase [Glutamicibacter protophormiae]QRQ80003.1 DUF1792 domain-containing protein [Glutamicibacter protophormiae]
MQYNFQDSNLLRNQILKNIISSSNDSFEVLSEGKSDAILKINEVKIRFTFLIDEEYIRILMSSKERESSRHLRNIAAPVSWIKRSSSNSYVILSERNVTPNLAEEINRRINFIIERSQSYSVASPQGSLDGLLPMYWWDKMSNFGDEAGPWIASKISGSPVVNMRNSSMNVPTLMSVGSVFAQIENEKTEVWGSGLISPLSEGQVRKLRSFGEIKIHALRGKVSAKEIEEKLGWRTPSIFGDPALLVPKYLQTVEDKTLNDKIGFVPHYAHEFLRIKKDSTIHAIDVTKDLESVAQEISQVKCIVSTSLHGIILAQAFEIPWVWLRITDKPLKGDDFKFQDFFSTLAGRNPSIHESTSTDLQEIKNISKEASLPKLNINLENLEKSFPHHLVPNVETADIFGQIGNVSSNMKKWSIELLKMQKFSKRVKNLIFSSHNFHKDSLNILRSINSSIGITSKEVAKLREENQIARKELRTLRNEVSSTKSIVDSVRKHVQSNLYQEIRETLGGRQKSAIETINFLAMNNVSFARFGDGEFRLMGHADQDISFQNNSDELRQQLINVVNSKDENLLIGFPQIYQDTNWSSLWAEIWNDVKHLVPKDRIWGNAHVTRPFVFKKYGSEAVDAWRSVWENKSICVITGKSSRFELIPDLFDNVSSVSRLDSVDMDAFHDIERIVAHAELMEVDIFVIALGPAGTVLAYELAKRGIRGLDIGHLSDSYLNVFHNAKRPESKPLSK